MTYINRRIQRELSEGHFEELSDQTFSEIAGPLVLLGEPGAGKTDTAIAIAEAKNGLYVQAAGIAIGAPLPSPPASGIYVIDGLDEVTQTSQDLPINIVLRRLVDNGITDFVVTCRAADWSNFQSQQHVQAWVGKLPTVGHLLPLSDDEIAAVVDSFGTYPGGGRQFVQQAEEHQALELARNPQSVRMLLAAISQEGWPNSKTALFELACAKFSQEHNRLHQSRSKARPNEATVLEA